MENSERYIKAKKKVDDIKGFYYHLTVYILVNIALLIFRTPILLFFLNMGDATDEGFSEWLDFNIVFTPLLWGLGVFIHYAVVFGLKPKFIKKWEKRKLEEILKEEDSTEKWM